MWRLATPWLATAIVASIALPASARADDMDVALSHLRIPGGDERCRRPDANWCVDAELFERLMSEVAMALLPPVVEPARSLGSRGFAMALTMSITSIAADELHWVRGSEGDSDGSDQLTNSSPRGALVWNRLHVRKGLPFGLEIGASAGQGLGTSTWVAGSSIKLALVEGMRTNPAYMPDIAVRATHERMFGSHQVDVDLTSLELLLSKPFLAAAQWMITPLAAVQIVWVDVDGALVDLTPEGPLGCEVDCGLATADPANTLRFPALKQRRYRTVVGVEGRRRWLVITASVAYDPLPPDVDARPRVSGGKRVEQQLGVQLSTGVRF